METVYKVAKRFNVKPDELIKILEIGGFKRRRLTSELDSITFKYINDYFNNAKELKEAGKSKKHNLESKEIHFGEENDIIKYVNANKNSLSVRAQNILNDKILFDLRSENFASNRLTQLNYFLSFRNGGRKTAEELLCFFQNCKIDKHEIFLSQHEKLKVELRNNKMFTSDNILTLINLKVNKLSVRSQKGILLIKSEIKKDFNNFFKYLRIENILKIETIGAKSASEISFYLLEILERLKKNDLSQLDLLVQNLEIDLSSSNFKIDENNLPSFFKLFELYFENKKNKLRYYVISKYLDGENYGKLGSKFSLSRERVRQIVNKFDEKLLKVNEYFNDLILKSEIDFSESIKEGNTLGTYKIIKKYDINLHPKIIEKLLNPKSSIRNIKYGYYQNEELIKLFDINTMINKVLELNKRVEDDFYLPLNGFIFNYLKDKDNANIIGKFYSEIQDIIFEKTGIITNGEGALVFLKNTKPKKYDAIIDLLEKTGRPMHLGEMSEITGMKKENIKGILLKERHLFINTAFSTYGLKKWEDEGKIKGGTIIDLIYQFLNSKSKPSHIYQIFKHVKQYRNTTERSIDGLIKSDTQNRFLKLGASFYGINGVHDDYKYEVIIPLPGSWHNFLYKNYEGLNVNVEQFIENEKRKFNIHELVIKANVEKRIDLGDMKIDDKGMLVFKKYVHSPKRGRPKQIE